MTWSRSPRRRRAASALGALAVASALALTASPAQAAEGSIDHVESGNGNLKVLFSLPDAGDAQPDLGSLSVSLDGKALDGTAALASSAGGEKVRRTTILTIDDSGKVTDSGVAWTFLGKNAAAVINALDSVTDLKLLQTPSVVVRNNSEAMLNVGTRIPIESVTVNPGTGGTTTYGQVQYLDTGVILKVRPRITRDGMVFLDLVQEVSSAGSLPARCSAVNSTNTSPCNPPVNTRKLQTETAVRSGDTVMLAGLISDGTTKGSAGFPGLSRIPIIGGLFGTQTSTKNRSEVVVLLTPTVLRNQQDANDLTDEYGRRFRALEPLYQAPRGR